MVSSMFRTLKTDLVFLFFIITLLCSSFLTACESGGGSGGCTQNPQPTSTQIKPFLALNVPIDNTLSFPMQYQTLAAQNIADRIDNYISPGISGMFVDVTLIETNSLQDTFVTFSVDAIQPIRPMPQVCNDPYLYAKQMRDWKKAVAKINNLVASTRARI